MAGVIAIEDKAGTGTIFKDTGAIVNPDKVAVMVTLPSATPLTWPEVVMVAIFESEIVQVTPVEMAAVLPSE